MAEASSVVTSAVDFISVSCHCGGLLSGCHIRPASRVRFVPLPDGRERQVTRGCCEWLAQHWEKLRASLSLRHGTLWLMSSLKGMTAGQMGEGGGGREEVPIKRSQ